MKYAIVILSAAVAGVLGYSVVAGAGNGGCPISAVLGAGDDAASCSGGACPINTSAEPQQCESALMLTSADPSAAPTTQPDQAAGVATTQPEQASAPTTQPEAAAVLRFTMKSLEGKDVNLARYQGKVVLIVNTASKCGLTPQYKGLQKLHETYSAKGLAILGFPANEFGRQEPGTDEQIAAFCHKNYGVTFDMFSKVVVKGEGICPLYAFLTEKETNGQFAGPIRWNFDKFLVARDGTVVARFKPQTKPESDELVKAIETELAKAATVN